MGISPFKGCSASINNVIVNLNPNPHNFKIKRRWINQSKTCTMLLVNYPNCKNFEGDKLVVMKGDYSTHRFTYFDPHFTESGDIIARLIPTEAGISLGTSMFNLECLTQ